jgi:hypothetical protein
MEYLDDEHPTTVGEQNSSEFRSVVGEHFSAIAQDIITIRTPKNS